MTKDLEKIKLKLYGLTHERNGAVRADVFASKLAILIKGLRAADKVANGRKSFNYLITDLRQACALAEVDEVEYNRDYPAVASSVRVFHATIHDISEGRGIRPSTPKTLAKAAVDISTSADKAYSHAEISIGDAASRIVRLDKFYLKRASRAYEDYLSDGQGYQIFQGTSLGSFDGILKEVDLRGTVARAKLILRAGNKEIDCICNQITVENLRDALNQNVTVSAKAHYNGKDRLPEQIEIKKIQTLSLTSNLTKWRGKFNIPHLSLEDVW